MKKILAFVLVMIVALVNVTPSLAMPATAITPTLKLVVVAPTYAFQGDTVQLSVLAKNPNKRPAMLMGWKVRFSKAVISEIEFLSLDGFVKDISSASEFIFVWSDNVPLKNGEADEMQVNVTLRADVLGSQTLVSASNRWTLHQAMIQIEEPRLTITLEAPTVVKAGSVFDLTVTISNPTQVPLPVNFDTEYWYTCTYNNPVIQYPEGFNPYMNIDWSKSVYSWTGTVPAGQTLVWRYTITSKSYVIMQGCGVFVFRNHLDGEQESIVKIDFVP